MPRKPGPCSRHPWFDGGRKRVPDCLVCRAYRKVIEARMTQKAAVPA